MPTDLLGSITTPDMFMIVGLGILITHASQAAKKRLPWLTAREMQFMVFAACLVFAIAISLIRRLLPAEAISTLGGSFTTAIAYYEVVVKKHE